MKDNLEKFIEEHRSGFDPLEPRSNSWQKIQDQMEKPKKNYSIAWKVAALILLVTSLGLIYERNFMERPNQVVVEVVPENEWQEAEVYYTSLINEKREEIRLAIDKKNLKDVDILEDIDVLDQMYAGLKKDLEQNTNNEKLISAMIQNLQLRVEILNKQLGILQQLEKHENNEIII